MRLKNAALLLAKRKGNINEISYMVGFSSPSYFAKCFLQQFGLNPSEYMKKIKK
jgi:AraC-like DNA-binding protein